MTRRGYLSLGSGRAICQLCKEKIAKGVPQINHRANRCTASFHANAKDCGIPRSKKYIKEAGCSNCGMVLVTEKGNCLNCFTMNTKNAETDLSMNAESSNAKLLGIGAGILATIFYMYFQK